MPPNLPVCGKLFHNTSKALLLLLKNSPLTLKLWIKEELSEMSDPKTLMKLFMTLRIVYLKLSYYATKTLP